MRQWLERLAGRLFPPNRAYILIHDLRREQELKALPLKLTRRWLAAVIGLPAVAFLLALALIFRFWSGPRPAPPVPIVVSLPSPVPAVPSPGDEARVQRLERLTVAQIAEIARLRAEADALGDRLRSRAAFLACLEAQPRRTRLAAAWRTCGVPEGFPMLPAAPPRHRRRQAFRPAAHRP